MVKTTNLALYLLPQIHKVVLKYKPKPKPCRNPECDNTFIPKYSTTEMFCSAKCASTYDKALKQTTPVNKVSDRRKKEGKEYSQRRKLFLSRPENKKCVINGTDCTGKATTIEHRRGREGYADQDKRDAGISLYLDEDYWLAACNNCNLELENNPELSKKFQLSKIHGGKKH